MTIFLKYVLRSMLEKKNRLFLLLTAIALSTGLLIGSMSLVDIALDITMKAQVEASEKKDIVITGKNKVNTFKLNRLKMIGVKDLIPQIVTRIRYGEDKEVCINLYGREDEYMDLIHFTNQFDVGGFVGEKCIISYRISKDYDLKVGDSITIEFENKEVDLEVYGIAYNEGLFYSDLKEKFTMIVPYKFLAKKLHIPQKYNSVIANKTNEDVKESIALFNEANKNFEASEIYDRNDMTAYMSGISSTLYIMLVIIVIMSIIIIYSSFKLIITERLGCIGTFLSQGATKGIVRRILYLESIIYGIIGGVIGNIFGRVIVEAASYVMSPLRAYGIINKANISYMYYGIGMLFAIILAVISSLIPILQIDKLQVKELILNSVNNIRELGWWRFIIGVIALSVSIAMSYMGMVFLSPLIMLMSVASIVMIFPKIIVGISSVIFKRLKGIMPINSIALNNVSTSKVLIGNITLMFISMLIVVLINSIGTSMTHIVTDAYENFNYDVMISIQGDELSTDVKQIERILKKNKKVIDESIQREYGAHAEVNSLGAYAIGVDTDKYLAYEHYLDWEKPEYKHIYQQFEAGGNRAAIVAKNVANSLGLKEKDIIEVEINKHIEEFNVIGIVDGKMLRNGNFIIIKDEAYIDLYDMETPKDFVCRVKGDVNTFKEEIKKEVSEYGGIISTYEQEKQNNIAQNAQLITVLNILSVMAIVISVLGIFNNISISFIQRKKSMVVLSSVGMTRGQSAKMLILESILTVMWASIMTIAYGSIGMSVMSQIMQLMGSAVEISFDMNMMPKIVVVSLTSMLLATIPTIWANKKFCIVEELKFE